MPDFWNQSFLQDVLKTQATPVEQQIHLWRTYAMTDEVHTFYQSYLFTEDKTMKLYVDDEHECTFVPFQSHYVTHPGQYEHLQQVKGESSLIRVARDYGLLDHQMEDGNDDILAELQEDD